jgi:CheY-like chemotaxis protein
MEDDTAPYALVVDDEPLILMDACDILSDAGFRPLEAGDVDEAIGILEEHADKVTLLFTDVQMPGGRDGFDLAREAARRWPEIRTLVASGAATPNDGDLPEGAVFISKPFSASVVHDRLQELLPDGEKPEPLKRAAQAD